MPRIVCQKCRGFFKGRMAKWRSSGIISTNLIPEKKQSWAKSLFSLTCWLRPTDYGTTPKRSIPGALEKIAALINTFCHNERPHQSGIWLAISDAVGLNIQGLRKVREHWAELLNSVCTAANNKHAKRAWNWTCVNRCDSWYKHVISMQKTT